MAAKPQVETQIRYVCEECEFYTEYVELIDGDADSILRMKWAASEADDHNKTCAKK